MGNTRGPRTANAATGAAILLLLLVPIAAVASGLTDAQKRGKRIYLEGKGRHRISAFLAGAGIKAPGSGFPCVNCHLPGGGGQEEGGIESADITWFTLTKEFSGRRPSGRTHPPYDEESAMTAVTSGLDPAGNDLDTAHPRYEMEREDLADLVAYLKVMDREPVPGIADNEVRVGILLPEKGPLAEAGREVRTLLEGYFSEVNARGGLYSRSLVLVSAPFDPYREEGALAAARNVVEKDEVFCFLANVGVGAEDDAGRYLSGRKVPVIAPLLSTPESGYGTDRYSFHIFASIRDQARVMTDFAAGRLNAPRNRVGLLYARDSSGKAGADGAKEQMKVHGLTPVAEESFSPGEFPAETVVGRFRDEAVDAVLYFGGPREAVAFAREVDRREWRPLFVAPAPMVGNVLSSVPSGFLGSVYLASPLKAPDPGSARMAEFFRLEEKNAVGTGHRTFQFLAYSGAILLEEGLRRSGKAVTRERLVNSIGNVWRLETGLTPPLTYNPNRRAGATGAEILAIDPESGRLVPVAPWREPQ